MEKEARTSHSEKCRDSGTYVEKKLEFMRKYLYAYTTIISKHFDRFWYIETEAGPGICRTRGSGRVLLGTPLLAMTNEPFFTGYRFIEADSECREALERRRNLYVPAEIDVRIVEGDCNLRTREVLETIPARDRFLAFMDPEGLEMKWKDVVEPISEMEGAEVYINFPFDMAIRRCMSPELPSHEGTITEYMGHDRWKSLRDEFYKESYDASQLREAFLTMYLEGLTEVGFEHTAVSRIIRSDNNVPLYYLIFGSRVPVAKKIMASVMKVDIEQEQRTLFTL